MCQGLTAHTGLEVAPSQPACQQLPEAVDVLARISDFPDVNALVPHDGREKASKAGAVRMGCSCEVSGRLEMLPLRRVACPVHLGEAETVAG